MPRGIGDWTLCEKCNNNTGAWYGAKFVDFIHQGLIPFAQADGSPTLFYPFHYFPFEVIKQIASMFFSINGVEFSKLHRNLAEFVLDPKRRHVPDDVRFFLFYATGKRARQSPITGRISTDGRWDRNSTFSEITWVPFGFVMAFDNPPSSDLLEITHWGSYGQKNFRSEHLKIPTLEVTSYLPGDYRTETQINEAIRENTEIADN